MGQKLSSAVENNLLQMSFARRWWNIDRRFRELDHYRLVGNDHTGFRLDWYPQRRRTKKWISPPDGRYIPGIITRDRRQEPARGTWDLWEANGSIFGMDIGVPDAFERLARKAVACIRRSGVWGKHILQFAGRSEGNVVDSVTIWLRLLWVMVTPNREIWLPAAEWACKKVTFQDPCGSSADLCIWLKASYDFYLESGYLPARLSRRPVGRPPNEASDGEEIRRLRRNCGFSQDALAIKSGVPLRVIQRAEAGIAISVLNLKSIRDTLAANQDEPVGSLTQQ